jgi:hypothetical protein
MLTIQSVVINKKIPLEKAEQIVTTLNKKPLYLNKKVTEYKAGQTINYWRFRQLASSKFKENSFRTKKINDNTFFILGELK